MIPTSIFFSDLDSTLLYDKREFIDLPASYPMVLAEHTEDYTTFISAYVHDFLQANQGLLVPVTARSLRMYHNVHLSYVRDAEWAVVENGMTILHHGVIDEGWKTVIESRMEEVSQNREITGFFNSHAEDYKSYVDGYLVGAFSTQELRVQPGLLKELRELALRHDYTLSAQGRLTFVMHNSVSKGSAVRYLLDRLRPISTFGAGDSFFDLSFLEHMDTPFCMKGRELQEYLLSSNQISDRYEIPRTNGILGSDQMIDRMRELMVASS